MTLGEASMALGGATVDEDGDCEYGESPCPILFMPFYHNAPLTIIVCQSRDAIFANFQTSIHEKYNFSTF